MLWDQMKGIYEQEKIPTEWRDSVIIPIYKKKGDIQDCGNYRGIKLMSHTMKIWERIIDRRLREETTIGDEPFGFMPGRGTTDAIFAVRQLMEKHREKQKELHIVFIDLEKAYDRVPRQEDEYVGKRVMGMEVPGKRRRGRPKRRWLDSIRNDLSEGGCQRRTRKTGLDGGVS